MAVPKRGHSHQRTAVRHTAYAKKQQLRLVNNVNIVSCPDCGERIPERTACPACGKYKGIQIIKSKTPAGVTVVQA